MEHQWPGGGPPGAPAGHPPHQDDRSVPPVPIAIADFVPPAQGELNEAWQLQQHQQHQQLYRPHLALNQGGFPPNQHHSMGSLSIDDGGSISSTTSSVQRGFLSSWEGRSIQDDGSVSGSLSGLSCDAQSYKSYYAGSSAGDQFQAVDNVQPGDATVTNYHNGSGYSQHGEALITSRQQEAARANYNQDPVQPPGGAYNVDAAFNQFPQAPRSTRHFLRFDRAPAMAPPFPLVLAPPFPLTTRATQASKKELATTTKVAESMVTGRTLRLDRPPTSPTAEASMGVARMATHQFLRPPMGKRTCGGNPPLFDRPHPCLVSPTLRNRHRRSSSNFNLTKHVAIKSKRSGRSEVLEHELARLQLINQDKKDARSVTHHKLSNQDNANSRSTTLVGGMADGTSEAILRAPAEQVGHIVAKSQKKTLDFALSSLSLAYGDVAADSGGSSEEDTTPAPPTRLFSAAAPAEEEEGPSVGVTVNLARRDDNVPPALVASGRGTAARSSVVEKVMLPTPVVILACGTHREDSHIAALRLHAAVRFGERQEARAEHPLNVAHGYVAQLEVPEEQVLVLFAQVPIAVTKVSCGERSDLRTS